jgi:hypothetical protein
MTVKNHTVVQGGRPVSDPLTKREAYRRCRQLCGKKSGGNKPYNVQRIKF